MKNLVLMFVVKERFECDLPDHFLLLELPWGVPLSACCW